MFLPNLRPVYMRVFIPGGKLSRDEPIISFLLFLCAFGGGINDVPAGIGNSMKSLQRDERPKN